MTDAYVYFFMQRSALEGKATVSARPATLEAIKGHGEAIMETQLVVDQTELDEDGFLKSDVGKDSGAVNDINAQIRSAEIRAASRDSEAMKLNDTTEGQDKYMLSLESRELRKQARQLEHRRVDASKEDSQDSA